MSETAKERPPRIEAPNRMRWRAWCYICAPTRTGKFRVGKDQLLTNAGGESRISVEDYAMAMVDELEKPTHILQRYYGGVLAGKTAAFSAAPRQNDGEHPEKEGD